MTLLDLKMRIFLETFLHSRRYHDMNSIYQILNQSQLNQFDKSGLEKLQQLVDANPIFLHLLPGIIGGSKNWRAVLGQAYIDYVQHQKSPQVLKSEVDPFHQSDETYVDLLSMTQEVASNSGIMM